MYKTKSDFPEEIQQKYKSRTAEFWNAFIEIANREDLRFNSDSAISADLQNALKQLEKPDTDNRNDSDEMLSPELQTMLSQVEQSRQDADYRRNTQPKKDVGPIMRKRLERSKLPVNGAKADGEDIQLTKPMSVSERRKQRSKSNKVGM